MSYLLIIIIEMILASALAVVLYWWDKRVAQKNATSTNSHARGPTEDCLHPARRQRISERTLLNVSLLGGWPGAWWASQKFRHKTHKRSFRIQFWIAVAVNIAINSAIVAFLIVKR